MLLGMGITVAKILFCHGISELNREKKSQMREYSNRTVYNCFNNQFSFDFSISFLILPPMDIGDSTRPNKISRYTPYQLTAIIYVASGKYVSAFTNPLDSLQVIVITSDDIHTQHNITRDNPWCGRGKGKYYSRFHDGIICFKELVSIDPHVIVTRGFITFMDL